MMVPGKPETLKTVKMSPCQGYYSLHHFKRLGKSISLLQGANCGPLCFDEFDLMLIILP